jgi:hypothetical protein
VDPLHLLEVVRRDLEPLYDAWTQVWIAGTPDAVQVGNELVDQARQVLAVGTLLDRSRNRLSRYLAGEKWSRPQIDAYQDELRRLACLRKRLAELARTELGVGHVELFLAASSSDGGHDTSRPSEAGPRR